MSEYVYRVYDARGGLVYIGTSIDPDLRMAAHMGTARWRHLAVRVTVQEWPDYEHALAAEAWAIYREQPTFNRTWKNCSPLQRHGPAEPATPVREVSPGSDTGRPWRRKWPVWPRTRPASGPFGRPLTESPRSEGAA